MLGVGVGAAAFGLAGSRRSPIGVDGASRKRNENQVASSPLGRRGRLGEDAS